MGKEEEAGAMSKRLEEMAEQALVEGGQRAQKLVAETGGFSEELKQKLENKILDAKFRNEHPEAFAAANMPVHSISPTLGAELERLLTLLAGQRRTRHARDGRCPTLDR